VQQPIALKGLQIYYFSWYRSTSRHDFVASIIR